jgi:hypothetical protein
MRNISEAHNREDLGSYENATATVLHASDGMVDKKT